jgi:cysteine desulfurase
VLETAAYLMAVGTRVDVLPVDGSGRVDVAALRAAITDDTALVSIMTANNEIGVLQPIAEIAAICRSRGVVFHTDAAQAAGKIPLDVKALGIDLMSLSAHKIYAPIGIGCLYIAEETPVEPEPLFRGGRQERGLRSGTLAPHLCVAFGEASTIAERALSADARHTASLRARFLEVVRATFPDVRVNAEQAPRLTGNLSLLFPGVDADRLLGAVQPQVAISTNAACSSGVLQPSHVLLALGLSEAEASSTLRIGFGRFNTIAEAEIAGGVIAAAAERIRRSEVVDIEAA